jgi:hypothetical protein
MSITPLGGWGNTSQSSAESHSSLSSSGSCPNCHSSDWQSASLVYREGLSTISSRTKGTAVGIGRVGIRNGKAAIGGGVYRGRTSGVKQTMLSKMAAPPQMRNGLMIFLVILCILSGLGTLGGITQGLMAQAIISGSIVCILVLAIKAVYEKQRGIYDSAMNVYENTRMCQRCGTFYIGHQSSNVETARQSDRGNSRAMMFGFLVLLLVGALALILHKSQSGIVSSGATPTEPVASQGSDGFRWPTDGLPSYIANALNTPDLSPTSPADRERELILGVDGQRQLIPAVSEDDCTGSGGCVWNIVDATTRRGLIEDEQGALHKTSNITNGYYDLLVEGTQGLWIYQYRERKYVIARCYERSNGLGSPARPVPCQGDAEPSASPKASMGYPVPEENFVDAYVLANSGRDDLREGQLTQLGHDEYKMGMTIDTQTLLLGGGMLSTRGKRAMDYLDKLDRQQHQTQAAPGTAVSDGSAVSAQPSENTHPDASSAPTGPAPNQSRAMGSGVGAP